MNWTRLIPGHSLFVAPTPKHFEAKRLESARELAEHHRQKSIEARDSAAWACAQEQHHIRMWRLYQDRADGKDVQ